MGFLSNSLALRTELPKYKPLIKFLSIFSFLYLSWYLAYEFYLHPFGQPDEAVLSNSAIISAGILKLLGFDIETGREYGWYFIAADGGSPIWVAEQCNGLKLFVLFTLFIIAFPGKIITKFIFIPIGVITIHFLNCIRIVVLVIIARYAPGWMEFNHTYTFTLLVYAYIFFLWYIWVKHYSLYRKPDIR
ncbi:MAG: exosortase family protein XrtF [Bacteroidetes bacterium]|nr:exosortase family protein XrtF [Bacteroidota bacterium]